MIIDIHNTMSRAAGIVNYPFITGALTAPIPGYMYTKEGKVLRALAGNGHPNEAKIASISRFCGVGTGYVRLLADLVAKNQAPKGLACLFDGEMFPTGLLPLVAEKCQANGIDVELNDLRVIRTLNFQSSTVPLRGYQNDAVVKGLTNTYLGTWWPRGVYQIATGGGKTEIAADIILRAMVPTMFLVHRKDLVKQAIERFQGYGINVGELDTFSTNLVTVTTVQSLMSWSMNFDSVFINTKGEVVERDKAWLKEKAARQNAKQLTTQSILAKIEQVFVDEAHLIATKEDQYNLFGKALQLMPNAYMRWGLTATAFLRGDLHNLVLEGITGSSIVKISNRELIDAGYLTECVVDMWLMPKLAVPEALKGWPTCYDNYIITNRLRNDTIADCYKRYPGPTLVLVNKISHGEILATKLGVPFLSGNSTPDERQNAIVQLKSGKLRGVVASTIWDEGIDIANIKTVILAGGGKSAIKNLQRLGRGLRLSDGKHQLQLVDFLDQSPGILAAHSKARKALWKDQGFKVNVDTPKFATL